MAAGGMIHVRVDAQTKAEAQDVLKKLDMSLSEAIKLYLRQIIFRKGIPFDVRIPNELTAETLAKSERGEELHEVSNVEELFKELDS